MDEDLKIYVIYLNTLHPELSKNQIKSRKAYFKRTHIIDEKNYNYLDPEYSDVDIKFHLFKNIIFKNNNGFLENRIKDFDIQKFVREKKSKTFYPIQFVDKYYEHGLDNPEAEYNMKSHLKKSIKNNEFITPCQKLFKLINEFYFYNYKNKELFERQEYVK